MKRLQTVYSDSGRKRHVGVSVLAFGIMQLNQFRCLLASSIITFACCACLITLLKSAFHSECINGYFGSNGTIVRPTATCCIAAAVLAFLANAVFVFKSDSRSKKSWALVASVCSKWQPVYFIFTSVERIIMRVIVISYSKRTGAGFCDLSTELENVIHMAAIIWNCAILLTGLSTICCDLDVDYSPAMRRFTYCVLAICLFTDAIGSYIWGNLASQVQISVASFNIFFDNQLTSCVTSQVIIAVHFLFVSCRSRHGRGWAYASLRFELDECGKSLLTSPKSLTMTKNGMDGHTAASATMSMLDVKESSNQSQDESISSVQSKSNVFHQMRGWLLRFQKFHLSRCRVFVIPCVPHDVIGRSVDVFALLRPAFDLKLLHPLQRLADMHPNFYVIFVVCFLGLPNLACSLLLEDSVMGISTLILNCCTMIMLLGFLSSRHHGLDRGAAKHVASSFRFATCASLYVMLVGLDIHQLQQGHLHPTQPAAFTVQALLFLACALLDCSPYLRPSIQLFISVFSRSLRYTQHLSFTLPAGWVVDGIRILGCSRFTAGLHW